MKTFEYEALDSSGRKKLGKVKAWSLAEAKKKIQQMGFYLVSVKTHDNSVGFGVSPTGSGINRVGSRVTSSYGKNPLSFYKKLKELFLPKVKMENS